MQSQSIPSIPKITLTSPNKVQLLSIILQLTLHTNIFNSILNIKLLSLDNHPRPIVFIINIVRNKSISLKKRFHQFLLLLVQRKA